ncbi:hypothetical protein SAMN05192529_11153 [Arachidicoccus rhizosphaerae]|jgi:hypothetical protein|uniref:YcxB-like C-terminal domain-containing protein n=1 Tax=Arachidicoccus rhizosphaerae TaxID=551991 RepID=A0A1H3ZIS3_9BACT|nr:YcxB family protein [Arachidicoccus rhizosphaerae]SEA23610.1 hypothetical protein SAMN05192529_11153 [Arachidicoccus rhizosphaerae]
MASFKVTTQLTKTEYCKLFLRLSYRQRLYQIITMMGILLLILSIVRFFVKSLLSENVQLFLLAFSIYGLVLFPILIWIRAKKIYASSLGLQGPIEYNFNDQGLTLDASSNRSTFAWGDFGKTEKTRDYLLLFGYNRAAYFLKLKDLQPDQIQFIEDRVAMQSPVIDQKTKK